VNDPTLAELAESAAEIIRELNHRTMPGKDELTNVTDVFYPIIGNLEMMAHRLPQLLDQLMAWLEREYHADRIVADPGARSTGVLALGVRDALTLAAGQAEQMGSQLGRAHCHIAKIKSVGRGE
jgi:hypothetical protein